MTYRNWSDLTAGDFAAFGPRTLAIQPLGSITQAAPHLPLQLDTHLTTSVLDRALPLLKRDMDVVVLPPLAFTHDPDGTGTPGALTVSAPAFLAVLKEITASAARTGVRRMVFLNAHDRSREIPDIAVQQARSDHNMSVAHIGWWSFARISSVPHPRTSAMLAARQDLVDLEKAPSFQTATVEEGAKVLNSAASGLARHLTAFVQSDLPEGS